MVKRQNQKIMLACGHWLQYVYSLYSVTPHLNTIPSVQVFMHRISGPRIHNIHPVIISKVVHLKAIKTFQSSVVITCLYMVVRWLVLSCPLFVINRTTLQYNHHHDNIICDSNVGYQLFTPAYCYCSLVIITLAPIG